MPPRSAPEPLGVTLLEGGANVAVFSVEAEAIELCLFDEAGRETERILLADRTGDVHHAFVDGLGAGRIYGLRAHGPWRPLEGLRFNPAKLLMDPYARRVVRPPDCGSAMGGHGIEGYDDLALDAADTAAFVPKAVTEATPTRGPRTAVSVAPAQRIVYELHVKGFTATHPGIPPALRGTLAGLAHPAAIAHLAGLGITTVELMPINAWIDERHLPPLGLSNYWGYNTIAFLAPDPRYAPGGIADVAAAVEALHQAGLEVVMDIVFNHTAESDEHGQTLSLRGLDNRTYYRLKPNPRFYENDTGCGHILALDRAPVWRLAMDAMRYWVEAAGVDGFRFDLAPALGRGPNGFDPGAPLLAAIDQDPVLRGRVMIAEPWDIGYGGYRLGDFPASWREWNDRYRDDVRRFWRGDGGIGSLATRLAGSSDIFGARHRRPTASVDFVTAHDGFTLADVVAYSDKHNEANGEGNRDGHSGEIAWNNGAEGPSRDPAILAARGRDVRALLATLLLSRGTPMLSMGDELGRTQHGNNNAYSQDNATTWIDWAVADTALAAFVGRLCALRASVPALTGDVFLTGKADAEGEPDVAWLALDGRPMTVEAWNAGKPALGMLLSRDGSRALAWFNAGRDDVRVTLPETRAGHRWRLAIRSDAPEAEAGDPSAAFDPSDVPARSVLLWLEELGSGGGRAGGVDPAFLDRLADLAGIAPEWWEVSGKRTIVSPDTKRALLAAMGLPAGTIGEARDSHERLRALAGLTAEDASAERCALPASLRDEARRFGLAAQLYTLRRAGDQGVGDLTTLGLLAGSAAAAGAVTLAINPLHALFPSVRERASPYQPSDRRFLDPIYIDLTAVAEIEAARPALAAEGGALEALRLGRLVDWPSVWQVKRRVLAACFEALSAPRRKAVAAFRKASGEALERFALFQALEEEAGAPSAAFPTAPKTTPALKQAADFAVYLQFLADEQLSAAGSGLAVGLYRDLAVGAAPDGAEVWSAPEAFMKGVTVGAPPDPFSADGQVWNIPPLDPIALRGTDYAHFRSLLRSNMRHAGALRIDHAMALTRLFVIPEGAPAAAGAYLRYPLEGMIRALAEESREAGCLVIGEDLGTVPDGFRERMDAADVFSYRVLFFERDGAVFRAPETYPAKAVACVATHDLPTLKGWWSGADIALDRSLGRTVVAEADALRKADREALSGVIGATFDELTPEGEAAIHAYLARSPSALVLAQVEDLGGESEPVNVPGTEREYPNWRRRLETPVETLLDSDIGKAVIAAMKAAGR